MTILPLLRALGRKLLIITFLCLVTFAVSGAAAAFRNIKAGDQAPPVALKGLDGEEHILFPDIEGKAVIVMFWATWSQRSLTELGDLEKFRAEYGKNGLTILAVNVESQTVEDKDLERIRSVLQEKAIGFPVVLDEGLETYSDWGVIATPTTAILDRDGIVMFELSGYPTAGYLQVDEAIRKALGLYVPEKDAARGDVSFKPNRVAMLHFGVGKRHLEKGFLTKALPELTIAAEADSRWADPRIFLGYAHILGGKNELAALELAKADKLIPGCREEVRLLRAFLLLTEEKVDGALALLQTEKPAGLACGMIGGERPEGSIRPDEQPSGMDAVSTVKENGPGADPEGLAGLAEVHALLEEGRKGEASEKLGEILSARLGGLGFTLKKEKKLSAMEKMELLMQQKQEQQ